MITNMNTEAVEELNAAGKKLLEAAYDFWKLHQKHCGSGAVVWLNDDSGHFVLFTRGEYKDAILQAANIETRYEKPLNNPFCSNPLANKAMNSDKKERG